MVRCVCVRMRAPLQSASHRHDFSSFPSSAYMHMRSHIESPVYGLEKKIEMLEFVEDARRHGHDINKACVESPSLVS